MRIDNGYFTEALLLQTCGGDGEIEIGVGVRLVGKREMPPLTVDRLKAVLEHGIAEDKAACALHVS